MLCAPGNPQGLHFSTPTSPLLRDTALYREVEPPFLTMEADLQQLKKTQHRKLQHWLQQQMKTFIRRQEGIIQYSIWLGPGPNSVGLPSAMQPPTGVQKRERVLCLPLARSALPCRLTRHSALGTVRLCPVGLARHSTPGMVLVIKCSSLAAKYCHCVRMALLSWLCTIGSAQLALHDWLCSVGSAQLALHGWLCSVGSARLALHGWLCSVGSARLALHGWLCSIGSARLALLGWLCSVGSATMYGTGYQNAVRKLPNAARRLLPDATHGLPIKLQTYASNKYGLTVAVNRYQMQQTTAARRMQFSECYDKRSSRHTARTYLYSSSLSPSSEVLYGHPILVAPLLSGQTSARIPKHLSALLYYSGSSKYSCTTLDLPDTLRLLCVPMCNSCFPRPFFLLVPLGLCRTAAPPV
ncbi:hypothetical protein Acr_07g0006750 [Actinidia rufa]|uniref:Uncharacterized protein n=1 Tax=Actinidia rufa TaxID=165716 RepID=A0A7J0EVR4_9ERIC|nr:hypothetical protein Acr_07g0006750 [Actinidia rufa]